MSASFTVHGLNIATPLLGLWQPQPEVGLAFAPPASEEDGEVIWSVWLPDDAGQAAQSLQSGFQRLQRARRETKRAGQTLDQLPDRWLEPDDEEHAYVFGSPAQPGLETLRYHLGRISSGDGAAGAYDYSLLDNWQATIEEYKAFMREMLRLLRPVLITETQLQEQLLAVSRTGLGGSLETVWAFRCPAAHMAMHRQTVRLSLESRLALLQFLGQVSAGAAILAARFSLGSPLLAMPAVWRYLQDVVEQAGTVAALHNNSKI